MASVIVTNSHYVNSHQYAELRKLCRLNSSCCLRYWAINDDVTVTY